MHSLSKIRRRMARLHYHENHPPSFIYMHPNCATDKAVLAFYFCWLIETRAQRSKILREFSLSNEIFLNLANIRGR